MPQRRSNPGAAGRLLRRADAPARPGSTTGAECPHAMISWTDLHPKGHPWNRSSSSWCCLPASSSPRWQSAWSAACRCRSSRSLSALPPRWSCRMWPRSTSTPSSSWSCSSRRCSSTRHASRANASCGTTCPRSSRWPLGSCSSPCSWSGSPCTGWCPRFRWRRRLPAPRRSAPPMPLRSGRWVPPSRLPNARRSCSRENRSSTTRQASCASSLPSPLR